MTIVFPDRPELPRSMSDSMPGNPYRLAPRARLELATFRLGGGKPVISNAPSPLPFSALSSGKKTQQRRRNALKRGDAAADFPEAKGPETWPTISRAVCVLT